MNDDMIGMVLAFAGGFLIGAIISAMGRREVAKRWHAYDVKDDDTFISRCPQCGDHYMYPPTCKPGYCAKAPKLALVKTRGGTPGKDIIE